VLMASLVYKLLLGISKPQIKPSLEGIMPSPISLLAAKEALANVGVVESGGPNRGTYVEIYQRAAGIKPGDPWCAAYCFFRHEEAARKLELDNPLPRSGYCPVFKNWAIKNKCWVAVATAAVRNGAGVSVGDLCLFYFRNLKRVAHIGIVVEVTTNGVFTVEGNTGPQGAVGVQREGDGVYKKFRGWSALGAEGGFVTFK
jgi:hypothetical protein